MWFHLRPMDACLSFNADRYDSNVEGLIDLCTVAIYAKR